MFKVFLVLLALRKEFFRKGKCFSFFFIGKLFGMTIVQNTPESGVGRTPWQSLVPLLPLCAIPL